MILAASTRAQSARAPAPGCDRIHMLGKLSQCWDDVIQVQHDVIQVCSTALMNSNTAINTNMNHSFSNNQSSITDANKIVKQHDVRRSRSPAFYKKEKIRTINYHPSLKKWETLHDIHGAIQEDKETT